MSVIHLQFLDGRYSVTEYNGSGPSRHVLYKNLYDALHSEQYLAQRPLVWDFFAVYEPPFDQSKGWLVAVVRRD